GFAIADLDGDGTPELVVMAVDNPPEQNGGYYSVGWRLEAGRPAGRLGPMAADPGLALLGEPGRRHHRRGPWPAWDAASGPHRRRQSARAERRLVPGAGCDDRPGHGRADGGLAPVGERLAGQPSPCGPAAHRQRVVFRGLWQRPGSAQRPAVRDGGLALSAAGIQPPRHPGRPVLLRARVPARRAAAGQRWHRALRPVLRPAAGGHLRSAGRPADPVSPTGTAGSWTAEPDMASGRWYPTLIALQDGRIAAVSGQDENNELNVVPENSINDVSQYLSVSPFTDLAAGQSLNGVTQTSDPCQACAARRSCGRSTYPVAGNSGSISGSRWTISAI